MRVPNRDECPVCGISVWQCDTLKAVVRYRQDVQVNPKQLNVSPFAGEDGNLWWRCDVCGAEWVRKK